MPGTGVQELVKKNRVEELSEGEEGEEEEEEDGEEEVIDWYIDQNLPNEEKLTTGKRDSATHGYGFGFSETAAYR